MTVNSTTTHTGTSIRNRPNLRQMLHAAWLVIASYKERLLVI